MLPEHIHVISLKKLHYTLHYLVKCYSELHIIITPCLTEGTRASRAFDGRTKHIDALLLDSFTPD